MNLAPRITILKQSTIAHSPYPMTTLKIDSPSFWQYPEKMNNPALPETQDPKLDLLYYPTSTGVQELNLVTGESRTLSSGLARQIIPYSPSLAEAVCHAVESGSTLYDIEKTAGMPAVITIQSWLRASSEFRTRMAQARSVRADILYELVLEETKNINDQTLIQNAKLKLETLRWAAEKGAPDRYGNKTTLIGDRTAPAVIIIDTGVPNKDNGNNVRVSAVEAVFTNLGGSENEKRNSSDLSLLPDSGSGDSSPISDQTESPDS